jgi:hypothetical protein
VLDLEKLREVAPNLDWEEEEYDVHDQIYDLFYSDLVDDVFDYFWDSGGPGAGADVESVYRLDKYYFARSSVDGLIGPFPNLTTALEKIILITNDGRIAVTEASRRFECSEWSTDELIARLDLDAFTTPPEISVNDKEWSIDDLREYQSNLRGEGGM